MGRLDKPRYALRHETPLGQLRSRTMSVCSIGHPPGSKSASLTPPPPTSRQKPSSNGLQHRVNDPPLVPSVILANSRLVQSRPGALSRQALSNTSTESFLTQQESGNMNPDCVKPRMTSMPRKMTLRRRTQPMPATVKSTSALRSQQLGMGPACRDVT